MAKSPSYQDLIERQRALAEELANQSMLDLAFSSAEISVTTSRGMMVISVGLNETLTVTMKRTVTKIVHNDEAIGVLAGRTVERTVRGPEGWGVYFTTGESIFVSTRDDAHGSITTLMEEKIL